MSPFESVNEKKKNEIKFILEVYFSCSSPILTYIVNLKSFKFQGVNLI